MRIVVPVILLAAGAVGLLLWQQSRREPFFVSGIIEADEIRVGSRVGGRVREVHAEEGRPARRGDVLIRLDPHDLNERLAEAQATLAARMAVFEKLKSGFRPEEVAQARARCDRLRALLDQLVAGPRPLEIRILEDKLSAAQAEFVKAEQEHARVKRLFDEGRGTREEMDDAQAALDVSRARLAVAERELELAREGTRAEEIAQARANLAEAEHALALAEHGYRAEDIAEAGAIVDAARAAVAAIQRQLAELDILSPCDCTVEAVDLQPGDLIAPHAPVVTLLDPARLWIRAYVPENRLDLRVGQAVSVRVDAYPGRRFGGEVSFVARQAEFTPANVQTPEERSKQVFRIRVELDAEARGTLRAGMSADVFLE